MKWLLVTTAALGLAAAAPAMGATNPNGYGAAGQNPGHAASMKGAANVPSERGYPHALKNRNLGYRYTQAFSRQVKRENHPYRYTQAFKNEVRRVQGATNGTGSRSPH